MKEENEIDQLFKEGTQHHFSFDEALWAQVESQLPTQQRPASFFSLNSLLFTLIIFCCSLIPRDNSYSQQSITPSIPSPVKHSISNTATIQLAAFEQKTIEKQHTKNHTQNLNTEKASLNNIEKKADNNSHFAKKKQENIDQINRETTTNISSVKTVVENTLLGNEEVKSKATKTITPRFNTSRLNRKEVSAIDHELPKIDLINLTLFPIQENLIPQYANLIKAPLYKSAFHFYEVEFLRNVFLQKNIRSNIPDIERYKKETEQPLSSFTVGINTVKQKKHFTYGLGVQLNKYTEKVSYDVEKESTAYSIQVDTSYRIINNQFNSNGIPVLLIEQVLVENRISSTVIIDDKLTTTNTIKRIRIPVFAGYNFRFKNWSTELRTALIPAVLFQSQGVTVQRSQDQIESLDTESTERLTFSINNQFRLGYAINESFAIGASIYMENDLRSYSKVIDSRLNQQGLGVWFTIKP